MTLITLTVKFSKKGINVENWGVDLTHVAREIQANPAGQNRVF